MSTEVMPQSPSAHSLWCLLREEAGVARAVGSDSELSLHGKL